MIDCLTIWKKDQEASGGWRVFVGDPRKYSRVCGDWWTHAHACMHVATPKSGQANVNGALPACKLLVHSILVGEPCTSIQFPCK